MASSPLVADRSAILSAMATLEAQHAALVDLIATLERPSLGPQRYGNGHRGLDKSKPAHTPYRVLLKGKVKAVTHSALLGWVVEVDHGLGRVVAYPHVLDPVKVGTVLVQGGTIGQVAGPGDNFASGTVTDGKHEHFTLQHKVGDYLAGRPVKDPTPLVAKSLAKAIKAERVLAKKLK